MTDVKVHVEYCGGCGHKKQFLEMAKLIKDRVPTAEIYGAPGRQASFEVQVNGELVYSKLQTMAFPNFSDVCELAAEVQDGKPIREIKQQQPINCTIM
ncbi:migration and invasion enhancer 1 [Venturia canescens]|uniref:migration and invasion enhancer 1 n=1 Tax=Venturia canescens TaxID=32260 RepID=UPI001C9CD0A7|nr:migration and invasion enhancer 1 [Venturia canescens]XP_043289999.1 migration and invasion enhancer 1 [Venturia canescens]XP_043290000.1 migration and invasion enhancer 1 [Venturia canescens]